VRRLGCDNQRTRNHSTVIPSQVLIKFIDECCGPHQANCFGQMKLRFDFVFSGLQPTFIYSRRGSSALHLSPFGAAAKNRYETAVVIKTQPQHYGPKTPTSMEGKKGKAKRGASTFIYESLMFIHHTSQPRREPKGT
jgi:hypothetical protein